jgi:hypothetical protein
MHPHDVLSGLGVRNDLGPLEEGRIADVRRECIVREYDALMLPGVQVGGAVAGDVGLVADRAVLAVPVIGVVPD